MPQNIVDVNTFTDPIVAPVDGDLAVVASVNAAIQGLANRTTGLRIAEGSFTPVVSANGTNNVTHSSQRGSYFRLGKMVFVSIQVTGNTGAGSTGALQLGGLPYVFGWPSGLHAIVCRLLSPLSPAFASGYGPNASWEVNHAASSGFMYAVGTTYSAIIGTGWLANQSFSFTTSFFYPTQAAF